jgi:hypothetical protein
LTYQLTCVLYHSVDSIQCHQNPTWLQGKLAPGVYLINFPEEDYSQEDIMSARLPSDTVRQVSGEYHGVSWRKDSQKWRAHIGIGRKSIKLGDYEHEKEAAEADDKAYKEAKAKVRKGREALI